MRLSDITDDIITLPDNDGKILLKKLFKSPVSVEIARAKILPIFKTPLLVELLDSLKKCDDIRDDIVDYMNAEYPQLSSEFRDYNMKRDDNLEGDLSPLGHKDED